MGDGLSNDGRGPERDPRHSPCDGGTPVCGARLTNILGNLVHMRSTYDFVISAACPAGETAACPPGAQELAVVLTA
jgi:hypothetical protein